jgi:ribosomal protein L29
MKDLKALSNESLIAKLNDLKLDLAIEKRKLVSTGVASKKVKTKEMKRTIAQINTLLKQRGVKY